MKLKYLLLSSVIAVALTACSDDKASSNESTANHNETASTNVVESANDTTSVNETSNTDATPDEVVKAFFDHVLRGNIEQAAELLYIPEDELDSPQYMKKVKQSLEEGHKQLGSEGVNLTEVNTGELDYSANKKHATISVTMVAQNDEPQTKDFDSVKTEDGWKLDLSDSM